MKQSLLVLVVLSNLINLQLYAQKNTTKDPEFEYTEEEPSFYKDPDVVEMVKSISEHSGVAVVLKRAFIRLPLAHKKIRTYYLPALGLSNIKSEMEKYPKGFLSALGVKKLILTGESKHLFTGRKGIGGVYFPKHNKLFLNLESSDLRYALHHELSHVIDDKMGHNFGWKEWTDLNTPGIKYDGSQNGCVISLYSGNSEEEDRAEILAYIMVEHQRNKDPDNDMVRYWCGQRECIRNKFRKMIEQLDTVFDTSKLKGTPFWKTVNISPCL